MLTKITSIALKPSPQIDPETGRNKPFSIHFETDHEAPFPQLIIRSDGSEHLFNGSAVTKQVGNKYEVAVDAGLLSPGSYPVQVESCRHADITKAGGDDWVKAFDTLDLSAPDKKIATVAKKRVHKRSGVKTKIYFGIHKHMHQPYYDTTDTHYWDGEKDEIFSCRKGAYTDFLVDAVDRYENGGLEHAGLSTSWSGSLIEQLNRCDSEGLCGGQYKNWRTRLQDAAGRKTRLGNPRVDFTAFGHFHPLMSLIPDRDIVRQIEWHQDVINENFDQPASKILFPPETAFHVRMIPALNEAGIEAVIYDSIHRARACENYPYAGQEEGMLPPNKAEQSNSRANDWYQLENVWAGSKISPGLLKPEYVHYEDADGNVHKTIAIPAERYLGNEDARGGFGALQYPDCFGQLYDQLVASGEIDPKHPPFFLLHSDGDNYGGGTDSYYRHNTEQLVDWLQQDERFELISIRDYLQQFPPDPEKSIHIEPGSWAGADNGDPQFAKWFSRYHEDYSPDLNSWAVLTAFQNAVHSVEDALGQGDALDQAIRLLLTAETSCYWYWTGQDIWDNQVTKAANKGVDLLKSQLNDIKARGLDKTGPTIFPPWMMPENPGGKTWGQGGLVDAAKQGVVHTFIHDISGIQSVDLILRGGGTDVRIPMQNNGNYPSQTSPIITGEYFTAELPVGAGNVRYFIEASDNAGNVSKSSLERVFLG